MEHSSLRRKPEAQASCGRGRARSAGSVPKASIHPDQVNRVKMTCDQCGYKSFPQWMNDKAHCLKCDAVIKVRPSCHQRSMNDSSSSTHMPSASAGSLTATVSMNPDEIDRPARPSSGSKISFRTRHNIRDAFHKLDMNGDGIISLEELEKVLQNLPVPEGEHAFNDAALERLLEEMDDNLDGVVDYYDFTNWIKYEGEGSAEFLQRMSSTKSASGKGTCQGHTALSVDGTSGAEQPGASSASQYVRRCTTPQHERHDAASVDGTVGVEKAGEFPVSHDVQRCNTPQHAGQFSYVPPAKIWLRRDQVDRVKMECNVCGYCSYPQWMNDKAHCLKCDAVLRTRPSCQQRTDMTDLPNLLSRRPSSRGMSKRPQSASTSRMIGPERFFYDKSSYTGMHRVGGPDQVPKGTGTSVPAFWTRH